MRRKFFFYIMTKVPTHKKKILVTVYRKPEKSFWRKKDMKAKRERIISSSLLDRKIKRMNQLLISAECLIFWFDLWQPKRIAEFLIDSDIAV